jgi:predicted enzyme related to lactoylglutathione lyase
MFKGMRTIIYHVEDLDKAKEWYSTVLGFKPYFDEPFYVGFSVGGYEFGLDPDMTGITKGNNIIVYWGVENLETALEHTLKLGAKTNSDIQDVVGGIKLVTVIDPFGNVFGIIENPHFKLD